MAIRKNKLRIGGRNARRSAPGAAHADVHAASVEAVERPRRRGIYLLPNLFTTAALFCGFYAIVQGMNRNFDHAAVAIFVAMVLDSMDGRVARWTNTQSAFGAEYDSLSDMVSFGAAPALVAYEWALKGMGKLGWIAAFIYVAGAALRLARFNTNIGIVDKRFFQGLPSPAAAALVAGFVWVMNDYGIDGDSLRWPAWVITIYAGLSMVSNAPFYSFKDVNFKKSVPFIAVFAVALGFGLVAYEPPTVLFGMFCLYGLSGFVLFFKRLASGRAGPLISTQPDTDIGPGAKDAEDASGR
ncbi:CDP-diacylglycerol--serine O-phosphatidyltransferase [Derxia gummosa]|uniref:CDP-diacylglycerol--serine O-phosphatidyltransferase n=1 Tax=Derxia gummosa DSM 723 TaxID=1121388 RepID=A0A8B6X995_9BURK|nr:CDP-diacylglycerol--serine O-phosphatidyltransferase [Derxia gummosa]